MQWHLVGEFFFWGGGIVYLDDDVADAETRLVRSFHCEERARGETRCTLVIVLDECCPVWRGEMRSASSVQGRPFRLMQHSLWPMNVRAHWTKAELLSEGGRRGGGRGEGGDAGGH